MSTWSSPSSSSWLNLKLCIVRWWLTNKLETWRYCRYAETVIYRIFYSANRAGNGRLTLRDIRRSDLVRAMQHVDAEEDINKVLRSAHFVHYGKIGNWYVVRYDQVLAYGLSVYTLALRIRSWMQSSMWRFVCRFSFLIFPCVRVLVILEG